MEFSNLFRRELEIEAQRRFPVFVVLEALWKVACPEIIELLRAANVGSETTAITAGKWLAAWVGEPLHPDCQRLKDVGLALVVRAYENSEVAKRQLLCLGDTPKVRNGELLQAHGRLLLPSLMDGSACMRCPEVTGTNPCTADGVTGPRSSDGAGGQIKGGIRARDLRVVSPEDPAGYSCKLFTCSSSSIA
jgi:hypothetical protein